MWVVQCGIFSGSVYCVTPNNKIQPGLYMSVSEEWLSLCFNPQDHGHLVNQSICHSSVILDSQLEEVSQTQLWILGTIWS